MKPAVLMLCVGMLIGIAGCGDSIKEFPCAKASGVVMCEGSPVQGAMVYFSPKSTGKSAEVGKPGFAITDEAGRFVLSTYGTGDGAVVGPHVVRVTTSKEFPCDCIGEETLDLMNVDIVADKDNEFEVKLPKRTAPAQKNPFDDPEEEKE
ncbi:MAG: hypothetical protein JNL58_11730 [Planctomyces sp.]|nr:hypothetical protein [Planctomyces sp.]